MARLTITNRLVAGSVQESSTCDFAVSVWDDSTDPWTADTPTTIRYRIDDPEQGQILDWQSVSPAATATITVTGTQNAITGCQPRYRRQLTVEIDAGLSTAFSATHNYWINNGLRT